MEDITWMTWLLYGNFLLETKACDCCWLEPLPSSSSCSRLINCLSSYGDMEWCPRHSIIFKIQYGRSFDHHGYNKFKCHLTAIADFRFSSVETLIELDWSFLLYKLHLQFCRNSDSHKDCLLKKKPLIFCNNSLKLSNFILWGELCRFLT